MRSPWGVGARDLTGLLSLLEELRSYRLLLVLCSLSLPGESESAECWDDGLWRMSWGGVH